MIFTQVLILIFTALLPASATPSVTTVPPNLGYACGFTLLARTDIIKDGISEISGNFGLLDAGGFPGFSESTSATRPGQLFAGSAASPA